MLKKIKSLIEKHDNIYIFRHKEPDYDAFGSQLGLKHLIQENYPDKKVFALGLNNHLDYLGTMDEVAELNKDGLAIVVDVAQTHRIDDDRFKELKNVIVIDHHQNDSDCATLFWHDKEAIAAAEMITQLGIELSWRFSVNSAKALMIGLVSDSGRFLFKGIRPHSFEMAAHLLKQGIDLDEIYQNMYLEDIEFKRIKGYAMSQFVLLDSNIAYLRNAPNIKTKFNVSEFTVSRGLVGTMGQIKGVHAWINFTETDEGDILTEIRSAKVPLDDVAREFGGGGHQLACGCTLKNWPQAEFLIKAIEKKVESYESN